MPVEPKRMAHRKLPEPGRVQALHEQIAAELRVVKQEIAKARVSKKINRKKDGMRHLETELAAYKRTISKKKEKG